MATQNFHVIVQSVKTPQGISENLCTVYTVFNSEKHHALVWYTLNICYVIHTYIHIYSGTYLP